MSSITKFVIYKLCTSEKGYRENEKNGLRSDAAFDVCIIWPR